MKLIIGRIWFIYVPNAYTHFSENSQYFVEIFRFRNNFRENPKQFCEHFRKKGNKLVANFFLADLN
jgi:hypothetical protein